MCFAIIRVKYRSKDVADVEAENSESLLTRLGLLRLNDEVLEYRVFLAQPKFIRTTHWEEHT